MPTSLGETFEQIAPPPRPPKANADRDRSESGLWDGDGFSFSDILDIINPLQHIPGLAYLYRELTGDEIGHAPRVLGGALFGGLIGAIVSLVNVIVDEETGKDIGEHAIALLFDGGDGIGDSAGGGDGDEAAPDSGPGATIVATAAAFSPMSDAVFDPAFTAASVPAIDLPAIDSGPRATIVASTAAFGPMGDAVFDPAFTAASVPAVSSPAIDSGSLLARARAAEARTTVANGAAGSLAPVRSVRDPAPPIVSIETRKPGKTRETGATHKTGEAYKSGVAKSDAGLFGPPTPTEAAARSVSATGFRAATRFQAAAGVASEPAGPWFNQTMMYGLDRYQTMARERARAASEATRQAANILDRAF